MNQPFNPFLSLRTTPTIIKTSATYLNLIIGFVNYNNLLVSENAEIANNCFVTQPQTHIHSLQ